MKRTLLAAWLLCPVALVTWHFGPGENHLARDRAGDYLRSARAGRVGRAVVPGGHALRVGPRGPAAGRPGPRRPRTGPARAASAPARWSKARSNCRSCSRSWKPIRRQTPRWWARRPASWPSRATMRPGSCGSKGPRPRNGSPRPSGQGSSFACWPSAEDAQDTDTGLFQRNLEATIRLEQMDLSTLLAKPLPKKCCNCKSLSQRKRKQCQSQCKSAGKKDAKKDHPQSHPERGGTQPARRTGS